MRIERALRRSGSPIQLAVCEGPVERARGLLGRPPPQPGHALWIVPCRAVHTWGMQYPIDVAFLDDRGLVLQVAPNCSPCRAYTDRRAHSVLEMRAGESARIHLRAGERLTLPLARLRTADRPTADESTHTFAPLAAALLLVVVVWILAGCAGTSGATRATSASSKDVSGIAELRMQAGLEYDSRAWARAESAYRELVHRDPRDREAWLRLGTALLHLGRHAEAADVYATLVSRGEDSRDLLQALAIARTAQAAAALRAAAPERGNAATGPASHTDPWIVAAERLERLLPSSVPPRSVEDAKRSPSISVDTEVSGLDSRSRGPAP